MSLVKSIGKLFFKNYTVQNITAVFILISCYLKNSWRCGAGLGSPVCCDMGQNDTIGKIELNPSIVLSSDNTNCKNDIQLFHQLFDELSVYRDYH